MSVCSDSVVLSASHSSQRSRWKPKLVLFIVDDGGVFSAPPFLVVVYYDNRVLCYEEASKFNRGRKLQNWFAQNYMSRANRGRLHPSSCSV